MTWFPTLLGNEAAKATLRDRIDKKTLSHAYIIEGPRGSGKHTLARLIAAALACERQGTSVPCTHCPACEKILNDRAVDVHTYSRGKEATVKIEAARKIREEMLLSPTENSHQVFIVLDADTMTVAAQNALLIALEEPPKNVLILLLVEDSTRLLPTVRSRAQRIVMSRFPTDLLRQHVLSLSADARALSISSPETLATLLLHANGVIGGVLALLSPEKTRELLEKRELVDNIIEALAAYKPFIYLYELSQALPRKREELSIMLLLLQSALTDLILLKKDRSAPLSYYPDRSTALSLADRLGIAKLFSVVDAIIAATLDLEKNANLTVVITSLFSHMKL